MFVVIATYTVKDGFEDELADVLRTLAQFSRAEPGCVQYHVQRSLDDRGLFVLYEQYTDCDAYDLHMETEHFRRYVLGEAAPRLMSRERAFFETLD